jgi:DNA-binding beta-propeller fold protein YncE
MDAHSVSIVDVATGTTIATLQTGAAPHEVVVSPDGTRAVVSIYGDRAAVGSSLMVINMRAPSAAPKIIELGAGNQRPHGLAFLPDGKRMLVTGEKAQRVLLVDLESGAIDSSMVTGQPTTHMVVTTRDGLQAFTTNIVAKSVSAIDVASRKVRATFQVGAIIEGIAVTADGREVWVGGNDSRRVYVLDGSTGALLHTIDGFGMPYRIGITPDKRTAVVSDPGDEKIHLIDVATHTVRTVIDVPPMSGAPASPQGVTISPDGATAFVTLKAAGRVAVVDIAAGRITGTLQVGAGSDGVGYSPLVMKR